MYVTFLSIKKGKTQTRVKILSPNESIIKWDVEEKYLTGIRWT